MRDNADTNIRTFSYGYDAVGNLLNTNDPDSQYSYTYDLVDRVTRIDNSGTSGVPNVLLNYSYDAAGNLLSVTDTINGTQAGTNAYTYDSLNRATRITQSGTGVQGKRVDMSYDAANRLTGLSRYTDSNSQFSILNSQFSPVANSSYSYDLAGRLTNLTHKRGANTIASYGFTYDAANRITQSSGTDGTQDYSYDDTNQLTMVDHSTQADEAYSYDANGNRTNAGYGTGTNNQLLTDGVYNYQYDDEGNRTRRVEIATGKVTEYVWDYRNRLSSVLFKDSGGVVTKTIAYTYDVNNQRIGKSIDGVTTERFVYDRNQISLVFDGAGVQTHRYLYGTQVDQILADERGGSVVWALADNLGTVRDVVDGLGVVLNHITYDSFGRVVSQSNASVEFRYGYTGREQDSETGLDYYRARYYDSAVGRFISEDPIGFGAGDGNLTRYVRNSPTNFIDPSGLRTEIYIHSGHTPYGHTAININGTVYTFGRYPGALADPGTGGAIGQGLFYKVNERYYLNTARFTNPEDTVKIYRLNLSPEEERQTIARFEDIFNNKTQKGTDVFNKQIRENGKLRSETPIDHRIPLQAHGRMLKQKYHLTQNSCNTTTIRNLPDRVQRELNLRAVKAGNIIAMYSPPHLNNLLETYSIPVDDYELIFGVNTSGSTELAMLSQ